MALQFRRGTSAQRAASSEIPLAGEPWFITDTGQLYIGDGATQGGVSVGGAGSSGGLSDVELTSETTRSLSTYSITSNIASLTTSTNNNYYKGLSITISGASPSLLNGTYTILSIVSTSTFTVSKTNANVSQTSAIGTVAATIPSGAVLRRNAANTRWEDNFISLSEIGNVSITSVENSHTLIYNSATSSWQNQSLNGFMPLDYLSDVAITSPSSGQVIKYNGTSFVNTSFNINDLGNVTITSPTNGQVLTYNSTSSRWVNGSSSNNLSGLTDVTITSPANGEVLTWNVFSSRWTNQSAVATNLDALTDVTIAALTNGQALIYNSLSQQWTNQTIPAASTNLNALTDVTIASPSNGEVLTYNSTTQQWINQAAGGVGSINLDGLTDVTISSPSNGQVLTYNSSQQQWLNTTFAAGTLDGLTDVTLYSPAGGHTLYYDASGQQFRNTGVVRIQPQTYSETGGLYSQVQVVVSNGTQYPAGGYWYPRTELLPQTDGAIRIFCNPTNDSVNMTLGVVSVQGATWYEGKRVQLGSYIATGGYNAANLELQANSLFVTQGTGSNAEGFRVAPSSYTTKIFYRFNPQAEITSTPLNPLGWFDLINAVIKCNGSSSITLTPDIATSLETVIGNFQNQDNFSGWPYVGLSFEFTIINRAASNTVTFASATGITTTGGGNMTVAANSSGRFMVNRTAANAYQIYRLS